MTDRDLQLNRDLVLIPAYEPDDSLLSFAEALLAESPQVMVVDDGSGEAFKPVVHRLPEGVMLLS